MKESVAFAVTEISGDAERGDFLVEIEAEQGERRFVSPVNVYGHRRADGPVALYEKALRLALAYAREEDGDEQGL